jgi:hypothetical protein
MNDSNITSLFPPFPSPSISETSEEQEEPQSSPASSPATTPEEQPKKRVRQQHTIMVKKCKNEIISPDSRKKSKKEKEPNPIPTIHNIEQTQPLNYSVAELKTYLRTHTLFLAGTKQVLHDRLFCYLRAVRATIQLQARFRGQFVRNVFKLFHKYQSMLPACINDQDFYSFEPLAEINKFQLICVTETEGSVYGFDLASIVQYKQKLEFGVPLTNPYTRSNLDPSFLRELHKIETASKMKIIPTVFDLDNQSDAAPLSYEKKVEMKAISLFQHINSLGNYSDSSWFMHLSRGRVLRLLQELYDIWNFRLNINRETKRNVCPPAGTPFDLGINIRTATTSDIELRDIVLSVLENFVYRGINRDAQCLGAFYVLGALTLVSPIAAEASPWLYQSFAY